MANLIVKLAISRPKFIFGCDVRHQEVHRVRHELAERHGADCTALVLLIMAASAIFTQALAQPHLEYSEQRSDVQPPDPE